MKKGEDLESIADDILSQKSGLGLKKTERKNYNKQIEDLAEFAPSASSSKEYSIFYPFTVTKFFGFVCGGGLLAMISGANSDVYGNPFAYNILEIGTISLFTLFGLGVGYIANKSGESVNKNNIKEDIRYIKRKVGGSFY